jgi:hypothetical protein
MEKKVDAFIIPPTISRKMIADKTKPAVIPCWEHGSRKKNLIKPR